MIKYTLTSSGTIPEYIVDGGYLPVNNNGTWPQDLDLIGVANDSATENSFIDEDALLSYIQEKNLTFINSITEQVTSQTAVASSIWSKLG